MLTHLQPNQAEVDLKKLLKFINPYNEEFTCVGYAPSKKRRCRNPIAAHNQSASEYIIRILPDIYEDEQKLRIKLHKLAGLALCRGKNHQDQACTMADCWQPAVFTALQTPALGEGLAKVRKTSEESIQQQQHLPGQAGQKREEERQQPAGHQGRTETSEEYTTCQKEAKLQQAETWHWEERLRAEECPREEERHQEEALCKEEEAPRKEEEAPRKEEEARREKLARCEHENAHQRREEAGKQREARQRADAEARVNRERLQREQFAQEWARSWTRYDHCLDHMQRLNTATLDEAVQNSVTRPIKSGRSQDIHETNVRAFLRHASDDTLENPRRFCSLLWGPSFQWYEGRLRRFFPKIVGDECLRFATPVVQVVNGLKGTFSSL